MSPTKMPSSIDGVNGIPEDYDYPEATPEGPYRILNQHHSKPRKLRVACVGAGASGLCLAYKMEKMMRPGTWELTLFDKNSHFGGTWLVGIRSLTSSNFMLTPMQENTYPGVACDIPAHDYNFSWDPKWDWSQFFASGAEIQKYFENFAERHGM